MSSSFSQMSRDKLSDFAFLYQTHDGHDGSKMCTCTTLCRPVSLKCPEISSLTLRFCLKTLRFLQWYLSKRCVLQWCLSCASVLPPVSQMSRDKLPDFAFLSQKHDGHDGYAYLYNSMSSSFSQMSRDKLSDFAFLYQTHHDGSKMYLYAIQYLSNAKLPDFAFLSQNAVFPAMVPVKR